MTSLSLPVFTIVLLAQLGLLGIIVLILHRLSTRYGLTLLLVFLGTLTAALQFRILGYAQIQVGGQEVTLSQGSFLLTPIIMLGLLVIYIVNGTQQARISLAGILLVTLVFAFVRLLPDFQVPAGSGQILTQRPPTQSTNGMVASALTLGADLVIMIIVYQVVCNLRQRHPSRTAAVLALLAAIWSDAFLYPMISFFGLPELSTLLLFHLAGKTLAVVALWPLLSVYLWYIAPLYPGTAAAIPRPALDLFYTSLQFEARARFHYSLLRTVSQVNQVVVHTSDAQTLVSEACRLLVTNRVYALAWIGLLKASQEGTQPQINPTAHSGRSSAFVDDLQALKATLPDAYDPVTVAARSGEATLERDITQNSAHIPWRQAALKHGLRSSASLPMRHAGHTLGVLSVYATWPDAFDREELDLLQELADDLAHALISLEARQQQAILHTAAETMQDGLFITNIAGRILYANPAIANLWGDEPNQLEGLDIRQVLSSDGINLPFEEMLVALEKKEKAEYELAQTLPDQRKVFFSLRASLAHDPLAQPAYIIINIRDTTRHRQYEHQLLTLNRFTTELVQTRDVKVLMDRLFTSAESLLGADFSGFFPMTMDHLPANLNTCHNIPPGEATRLDQLFDILIGTRSYLLRRPVSISDTLDDPGYATRFQFLANEGVRALLLLPVVLQDHPIGALVMYYRQPRTFSEEELQLGLTLAYTLAISLENARLYQAEKSQREFAEALAHGAAALNSSLEFDRVLDQILDQAIQVIHCRSVNIMLIESELVRVVRHLDRTDPGEINRPVTGKQLPLTLPTLQQMLDNGQPLVISNTYQDAMWMQLDQTKWIGSYAAAPLQVQGQIIGFLNMNSDQVDFFTTDIIPRLQAFADTAAAAIQNARIFKESQLRGEELATLVEAAAVVSTSLDLNQVLMRVAEQMARMLNIRGCAISDYNPATNSVQLLTEFAPQDWTTTPDGYKPFNLEQYPLTRQVIDTGKPALLHIDDPGLEFNERSYMERNEIGTLLMLPLRTQDRTIGLVELIDDRYSLLYTPREIELVQTLSVHAAIAIENARLYQRTQQYTAELEDRVHERTQELRTAKERIEQILVSVPHAIFVLDEVNRPVQANPAGEALMILAEQQGLDIFAPDFLQGLTRLNTPAENAVLQIQERAYQALASSLDVDGHSAGTVIVFRDVTRFRELDQMKNQFVSDVSHELRTPLTNISLYLDLLSKAGDPDKSQRYLATLRRETQRLTSLIEDLLTISRLEAGRVEINIEPVDVNRIVTDLTLDRIQMAANQELTLTYSIEPDLPPARADPRLLTQVLSNLLTNALNYTPPKKSIHLQTGLENREDGDWITVSVSDTGLGIPSDELEHIFTRFFRGYASEVTNAPGTGLGLSISKEIIDRLNGYITVQSQHNQGSTFTVWLRAVL